MIAVIQRVSQASVVIEGRTKAEIQKGLLVLVGIEGADGNEDVDWLSAKMVNLRIFNDAAGVMKMPYRLFGVFILFRIPKLLFFYALIRTSLLAP